ncbi:hypothetical protein [Maritalea sp.]|jgi:hypothetical protein|uniref:hypothetical protein n=1 Tax=Maritalea sp. TaxID=2003361 RepID=UPI0039E5B4EF
MKNQTQKNASYRMTTRYKLVFFFSILSALYGLWSGLASYFPEIVPYYLPVAPRIGQSNFMLSLSVLAMTVVQLPKLKGTAIWITDLVLLVLFVGITILGPEHPRQLIWFLGFICFVIPLMPQREIFGVDRAYGGWKKGYRVRNESIDAQKVVNSDAGEYSGEIGKTTRTKHHWD